MTRELNENKFEKQNQNTKEILNDVSLYEFYLGTPDEKNNYLCPFHTDTTPSLVLFESNKDKIMWSCFPCDETGDIINLVEKKFGVDFKEALRMINERKKLQDTFEKKELKNTQNFNKKRERLKNETNISEKRYDFILKVLNLYLHETLLKNQEALDYLKERGFTKETILKYTLGLWDNRHNLTTKFFYSYGITKQELLELGIAEESKKFKNLFYPLSKRIVFPIRDEKGTVKGFCGRKFLKNDDSLQKYKYSANNPYFGAGMFLFNLDKFTKLKSFNSEDEIIVVEGLMDAIKLTQNNILDVVAIVGIGIGNERLEIFKNLNKKIVLMLDNDAAGVNATVKNFKKLKNLGLEVEIVLNPNDISKTNNTKDADEIIQNFGLQTLKEYITNRVGLEEFIKLKIKEEQ